MPTITDQLPTMDANKAKLEQRINEQRARIAATEAQIEELYDKLGHQRKHLRALGNKLSESETFMLNLE